MALHCESRSGLFRPCLENAVGLCTQCNKPFCARHGEAFDSVDWVCFRQRCQMKATVIQTALVSRRHAAERNAAGLCGTEPCGARQPNSQCSLCSGKFCVVHLNARTFRVMDPGTGIDDRPARYHKERHYLCDQCDTVIDRFRLITLPPIPEPAVSPASPNGKNGTNGERGSKQPAGTTSAK